MSADAPIFEGVCTINPIPFTLSDEVNEEEYRRHVEFMVRGGVRMIIPGGMVASGVQLSQDERLRLIKITVDQVKGRGAVFPHCYILGTKNTVRFIQEFKDLGADGPFLPTPLLWQSGPEAVYQHYRTILDGTDVPIIIYSCPTTTGTAISSEVASKLLDEFPGRILGYKQQVMELLPFDVTRLGARINLAPPCWDGYTIAGLKLGCRAQASIGGAFVPEALNSIFEKWDAGDERGAIEVFERYLPLFQAPQPRQAFLGHRDYYAGAYVYMLNRMGWNFGQPRLPFLWPIPRDLQHHIDGVLEELGLGDAFRH
jgi:4-hydroxy-tetrahydrodipicolinate synthase